MIFFQRFLSIVLLAALSSATLSAQVSATQQEDQRIERFKRQLEGLRLDLYIPALSAAVIKNGKVVWAGGFGFSDMANHIPATEKTPYRIASLTKTFASTLIMQLVEQGKVSLDDPMSKFDPSFKDDSVKVRHVMSHTSEGTPGEKYSYNGNRYATLDAVINKASGSSFRVLLTEKILAPLEMYDSVPGQNILNEVKTLDAKTSDRYSALLTRLAKPYTPYAGGLVDLAPYPPQGISSAAGLVSTVMDLAKYDAAIDANRFMKRDTKDRAWSQTISNDGHALPYGLGWFVQTIDGVKTVWHYGQWPTFSALYLKVPEKAITLIVLTNSGALSAAFNLGAGDLTRSPLALTFLRIFIFEDVIGHPTPDPEWAATKEDFSASIDKFRKQSGYAYKWEQAALILLNDWRSRLREHPRVGP
jgi:CubicO group peptidase (beta-lactamase class C family)